MICTNWKQAAIDNLKLSRRLRESVAEDAIEAGDDGDSAAGPQDVPGDPLEFV